MHYRRSVGESIPSAAVLRRPTRRIFVEPPMAVVRMGLDDAVLHPAREGGLVDSETSGEFLLGEQPASTQSIGSQAEAIRVHDVLHSHRRESRAASAGPRGTAWTKPSNVENLGDLIVE